MRNFVIASVLIAAALFSIKLLTAEVRLADDPTVALAIKPAPSMENLIRLTEQESLDQFQILILDENDFVGRPIYEAITSWGWIALPLLTLIFGFALRLIRRRSQHSGF